MVDKMTPQDMEELASRISEEIIARLGGSLEGAEAGPVNMCGPNFVQCGNYTCSGNFQCSADFKCKAKYGVVTPPKLQSARVQIDGGCGSEHAFSECGDYTCKKEFRCEAHQFMCNLTFTDTPNIFGRL